MIILCHRTLRALFRDGWCPMEGAFHVLPVWFEKPAFHASLTYCNSSTKTGSSCVPEVFRISLWSFDMPGANPMGLHCAMDTKKSNAISFFSVSCWNKTVLRTKGQVVPRNHARGLALAGRRGVALGEGGGLAARPSRLVPSLDCIWGYYHPSEWTRSSFFLQILFLKSNLIELNPKLPWF